MPLESICPHRAGAIDRTPPVCPALPTGVLKPSPPDRAKVGTSPCRAGTEGTAETTLLEVITAQTSVSVWFKMEEALDPFPVPGWDKTD